MGISVANRDTIKATVALAFSGLGNCGQVQICRNTRPAGNSVHAVLSIVRLFDVLKERTVATALCTMISFGGYASCLCGIAYAAVSPRRDRE